jgi:phospholipid N-methyltransferase
MKFFQEYIKNLSSVGAIAPSSRFLAKKMTSKIPNHKPVRILEVGAGTGVFTSLILKSCHKDSSIVVSELNPYFCNTLENKFGDSIDLIKGDILNYNPDQEFDFIICSIPFNSLPIHITKNIFAHFKTLLHDDGLFLFFEYSLISRLKPNNDFHPYKNEHLLPYRTHKEFTFLNLPPATVHTLKMK